MEQTQFDRIDNSQYTFTSSFALWHPTEIRDCEVILRNISQLTTSTAIVGLNGAGKSPDPPRKWGSYHCSYRGCKDSYLREGFQIHSQKFMGAYMTDLVKDCASTSQKNVIVLARHLNEFQQELEFVGMADVPSPIIIALGDEVYEALVERTNILPDGNSFLFHILSQWRKPVRICRVSHHARKGYTKKEFTAEVLELANTISNSAAL